MSSDTANRSRCYAALALGVAMLFGCSSLGPNPCIVTPPESYSGNQSITFVAKRLSELGTTTSGIEFKAGQQFNEVFQEIPDKAVACQMILQTITCVATMNRKEEIVYRLIDLAYQPGACRDVPEESGLPRTVETARVAVEAAAREKEKRAAQFERVRLGRFTVKASSCENKAVTHGFSIPAGVDVQRPGVIHAPPGVKGSKSIPPGIEVLAKGSGGRSLGAVDVEALSPQNLRVTLYVNGQDAPRNPRDEPLSDGCIQGIAEASVEVYAWIRK